MRNSDDLIKLRAELTATISLDRERVIEDPVWASIADTINLEDPEQLEQALFAYLRSYINRQQLFGECIFMPSNNGPGDIQVRSIEEIKDE